MRPNILVVDDRPENLVAFSQLLRTFDANILEASSGAQALEILLIEEVALALVDVQMPSMDGYELATLMRGAERTRDIPIIFVTAGSANHGSVLEGYDVGAVDFMIKPIEPRLLENKVGTFLRLYRQRCELAAAEQRLQRMLATVQASETRLRAMADAMPQLVWTAGSDGLMDYFNSRLSEYAVGEGVARDGWSWTALLHPDDLDATVRAWEMAVASGEHYACEQRLRMSDGSYRWHLTRARLVRGRGELPDKWFGTATDIHDRKHAELLSRKNEEQLAAALAAAERAITARDRVVSIVSHDLRNPLGVLQTTVTLIDQMLGTGGSVELERRVSSHLSRMKRQISSMDRLIDELLDVAKLQTGQPLQLRRQAVDLVELVRELTDEFARATPERAVEVRSSVRAIPGMWDPRRLEQVIQNLLANARKYSAAGSRIIVRIDRVRDDGGDGAALQVIDEGVGIPLDERERIFEWFARARNVDAVPGTGIGLAGARQIVEQHGGSIQVDSQEGVGSTFIVYLPASTAPASSMADRREDGDSRRHHEPRC